MSKQILAYMKELFPARVVNRKHEVLKYKVNGRPRFIVEPIAELSMDDVATRMVREAIHACGHNNYPDIEMYLYQGDVNTESKSIADALDNLCDW